MTTYSPDCWVVIKISQKDKPDLYKVFGSWYGGYTSGDSWKCNSGITKVRLVGDCYEFHGVSGSKYICRVNDEGTSGYGTMILGGLIDRAAEAGFKIEIVPVEIVINLMG